MRQELIQRRVVMRYCHKTGLDIQALQIWIARFDFEGGSPQGRRFKRTLTLRLGGLTQEQVGERLNVTSSGAATIERKALYIITRAAGGDERALEWFSEVI